MRWQKSLVGPIRQAIVARARLQSPLSAMDKSMVTKATSPDEVPTPGYMFNEIARITQSSADACKVTFY